MNKPAGALLPLTAFFLLIALLLFMLKKQITDAGFDITVLHISNAILFFISVVSFFIQLRGIRHSNPHVFVRSVMSGVMLKMLVVVAATFAYVYSSDGTYNKRSVMAGLFLYLVYLAIEVFVVMKLNKKKNA